MTIYGPRVAEASSARPAVGGSRSDSRSRAPTGNGDQSDTGRRPTAAGTQSVGGS